MMCGDHVGGQTGFVAPAVECKECKSRSKFVTKVLSRSLGTLMTFSYPRPFGKRRQHAFGQRSLGHGNKGKMSLAEVVPERCLGQECLVISRKVECRSESS